MEFKKSDVWRAAIAGEAIAILSIPILKNISIFEILIRQNHGFVFFALVAWLVFLPAAAAFGIYAVHRLAVWKWPSLFEVGKYGIIGLLNTFLAAGILNFLILITGAAEGWLFDGFVVLSFVIATTHSFFWNRFWIFKTKNTDCVKKEYARFFTVTGSVSVLTIFLMHILVNVIGAPQGLDIKMWVNISFALLVPVSFLGNFFGYKIYVFNKKHNINKEAD